MTTLEWKQLYEGEAFKHEYECPEEKLGIAYTKEKTRFRVWAPMAQKVILHLYPAGTREEEQVVEPLSFEKDSYEMDKKEKGIFEYTIEGDCHGVYYTYEVTRDGQTIETQDPYAIAAGANGMRSMVVDLERTNPADWEEDAAFSKSCYGAIIYELHIKDFSYDPNSGIDADYRGKYLAFTQTGTTVKGEGIYSSGIDYLKELGVTHVHLLPSYDYGSVDETGNNDQFNWGYDPVNYNVPEGSYATDAYHGEVRISEYKQMVKALHQAGIGVILDVVYNHTYSLESPLQKTAPYYFYRQNEDGSLCNGSGCGNETASDRAMYRKYMIDSVLYWAKEYHVDGFRFDLMGVHDVETMNEIRKVLDSLPNGKRIMMYGEPWSAEPVELSGGMQPANKSHVRELDPGVAIFHDGTRDAIKGSVFEAKEAGFVNGEKGLEEEIKHAICAWCDEETNETPRTPGQVISYVSAHDNYTLWDKLALTMMEAPEYRYGTPKMVAANRLVAVILEMGLGTPFFQAGEEFLRTKYGNDNSYASSPQLNQLDWCRRQEMDDMVQYYKGLIKLRKKCPVFASIESATAKEFAFDRAENGIVSYQIPKTGSYQWPSLYVILNSNDQTHGLQLPHGTWQLLVDGYSSEHWEENSVFVEGTINVKAHSAVVLGKITKREGFENQGGNRMNEFFQTEKGGKIMDFFSKMGETISSTSKKVADTAKDQAEILSLKAKMSSCDTMIKHQYEAIGKMIFEAEKEKIESPYRSQIEEIQKSMEEKDRYQQKIDLLKEK